MEAMGATAGTRGGTVGSRAPVRAGGLMAFRLSTLRRFRFDRGLTAVDGRRGGSGPDADAADDTGERRGARAPTVIRHGATGTGIRERPDEVDEHGAMSRSCRNVDSNERNGAMPESLTQETVRTADRPSQPVTTNSNGESTTLPGGENTDPNLNSMLELQEQQQMIFLKFSILSAISQAKHAAMMAMANALRGAGN